MNAPIDLPLDASSPLAADAMRQARALVASRLDLFLTSGSSAIPADSGYIELLTESVSTVWADDTVRTHLLAAVVWLAALTLQVGRIPDVDPRAVLTQTALYLEENPGLTL